MAYTAPKQNIEGVMTASDNPLNLDNVRRLRLSERQREQMHRDIADFPDGLPNPEYDHSNEQ